jgi:3'-phosphoadenosine 5'-phosphosulfate sulfotransferase (PAPS reductase)/FAD synthetase
MNWKLAQKQSLPLEAKIILTQRRISEWYEYYEGNVDIFFSGGWDSTILLDIARGMYPDIAAVFVDTGLEFPEIKAFVKTFDNVVIIRPKMSYRKVIKKYGHPVISKKVSMAISRYRGTKSEKQRDLRANGGTCPSSGKKQARTIPKKYHRVIDAPFKISDKCCDVMKKEPAKRRHKESGNVPMTAEMAVDSKNRQEVYNRTGCNAFDRDIPKSMPMSFWTHKDKLEYTKRFNLKICIVYSMGYDRTGCYKCKFGCDMEPSPGRFVLMKDTHPDLWESIVNDPEEIKVLNFLEIPYGVAGDKGQELLF